MTYISELERGEAAARLARVRLGLGLEVPVADIVLGIEDLAGIPVTVLALPGGLAGLQGRKHDRSFIFVNGADSAVRQRFTLAHEFGHVELGHIGSVDYTTDVFGERGRPPAEVQADGFASEFLAPADGVRRWLAAMGEPPDDLDTVVRLAEYFHVSAEAALYRLQRARHLTKGRVEAIKSRIAVGEHSALCRRLGLGEHEDTLSHAHGDLPRMPRATITEAATAYERGLLTVEQIARLLEVDPDRVHGEFDRRGIQPGRHEPDY
jgi:Zn-dependent peptidase ImmA (M78 family)